MSFTNGFEKLAADPIVFSGIGKALGKGLKSGGASTVSDTLKLKGLKHIHEAAKGAGGYGKALTTQAGREALAEGVGKAAPSIATGAAYMGAAKKVYDKVSTKQQNQGYY